MANKKYVTVELGGTLSLGNFQNIKCSVTLSDDVTDDENVIEVQRALATEVQKALISNLDETYNKFLKLKKEKLGDFPK